MQNKDNVLRTIIKNSKVQSHRSVTTSIIHELQTCSPVKHKNCHQNHSDIGNVAAETQAARWCSTPVDIWFNDHFNDDLQVKRRPDICSLKSGGKFNHSNYYISMCSL